MPNFIEATELQRSRKNGAPSNFLLPHRRTRRYGRGRHYV